MTNIVLLSTFIVTNSAMWMISDDARNKTNNVPGTSYYHHIGVVHQVDVIGYKSGTNIVPVLTNLTFLTTVTN